MWLISKLISKGISKAISKGISKSISSVKAPFTPRPSPMTNIPLENGGKYRIKLTDGTTSKYLGVTYERSRWRYKTISEDKKEIK